ncbi:MAG: hypothetical protein K1000chlam4_00926 [Chlamydiae bacterium]|nr:hypothetical protein [Chlamydiota bacterium]
MEDTLLQFLREKSVLTFFGHEKGGLFPSRKNNPTNEWAMLEEVRRSIPEDAQLPRDLEKDRYPVNRLTPYKDNAYPLQDGTYINASSLLHGSHILTQGPLHNTVGDFWSMVWESKSDTIVMATDFFQETVEGMQTKCDYYFDESDSVTLKCGITISCQESGTHKVFDHKYIHRIFSLSKGEGGRIVHHFQFVNWDDHHAYNLSPIHAVVQKINELHREGPIIAHCSAGIGRSAVVCVCHLLHQLHTELKGRKIAAEINVFELIKLLRTPPLGRHHAIANDSQYRMVYDYLEFLTNS